MTQLEALEQRLYDECIPIYCYDFNRVKLKGLYLDGMVFISPKIEDAAEKRCILMEEYCHHCYNYGNVLRDRKQEALARRQAYEMLVPVRALKAAKKAGCCTVYEIADRLEVTEDVLISALEYYHSKGAI